MENIEVESKIESREIRKRVFRAIRTTTLIYLASIFITIVMIAIMS